MRALSILVILAAGAALLAHADQARAADHGVFVRTAAVTELGRAERLFVKIVGREHPWWRAHHPRVIMIMIRTEDGIRRVVARVPRPIRKGERVIIRTKWDEWMETTGFSLHAVDAVVPRRRR